MCTNKFSIASYLYDNLWRLLSHKYLKLISIFSSFKSHQASYNIDSYPVVASRLSPRPTARVLSATPSQSLMNV